MPSTLLCATVTADSMAELRHRRDEVQGADLVELRLDGIRDLNVAGALAGRRLPVIATVRPARQGGRYDGDEMVRVALLEQAWTLGADYVDVEDGAAESLMRLSHGARIVRSFHDFEGVPADAADRLRRLLASGAQFVKLAAMARRLSDVVALADIARLADGRAVVIGMGPCGAASRVLAAHLGSPWTYAGDGIAPGQLFLARMRDEFHVPAITAATAVYGLVGRPIEHSLSPAMHNAAFRAAGLDAVYVPLPAADFADFEAFARAFAVRGVSVTAPYKLDARRATGAAADDSGLGAVNTLRRTGDGWAGRNTDIEGFLAPLEGRELRGARASVIGAGGAARAVATALASRGADVRLHARRADAAAAAAAACGVAAGAWPPAGDWDVLVNATPVGTTPHDEAEPIVLDGPLTGRLVYDLVYHPPETALLRRARRLGADVIGGLPMLVAQAAAQFHWWTGHRPSTSLMLDAARTRLAAEASSFPVPFV
ncbi:MAG TPA: type I 3-dehydroquinate dehydratase [Vicinamibacterales bacterium]|nr:type I 3-dehydroquinate dehydratase [Vicinamibacterales bacterium]